MRVYLDNAATSWPKPTTVYDAVDQYQRHNGAPAGRSGYSQAMESQRIVQRARTLLSRLIGSPTPQQVVFTFNGTDALNLAIHGFLQPGDHVVTTVSEHNSVLRPLSQLERAKDISVTYVPCNSYGFVNIDELNSTITPETRLVALVHVSNVTGAIQPVAEICQHAHRQGAKVLVDGAQSVGHIPVNVMDLGVDLFAFSGHKGLLGPLGTGGLYLRAGIDACLNSLRQGGTGSVSEQQSQPDTLPDKYESGNHNVPGLAGLTSGLQHLLDSGIESFAKHSRDLTGQLLEGLANVSRVTIHGPDRNQDRTGVVSITINNLDSQDAAMILDTTYGIQIRAGLHCAPRMHQAMGTEITGGTVRFSPGPFTTADEIETTVQAVTELAQNV